MMKTKLQHIQMKIGVTSSAVNLIEDKKERSHDSKNCVKSWKGPEGK